MIRTLGAIVGAAEPGRASRARLRRTTRALRAASAGRARPRVYFEEWDDPMICGIGWVSELIVIAGGPTSSPPRGIAGRRRAGSCAPRTWSRGAGGDPRFVVRQESPPRAHRRQTRLGGRPSRRGGRDPRDQVVAHPSAGPAALTDGLDAIAAALA